MTRYGSATVPMDEARATAAVDLVRRPHAEVSLASAATASAGWRSRCSRTRSSGSRSRPGLTMHVEAAGEDDHHVAEAAFKALGRALREACSTNGAASGSTKGPL